MNSFARFGISHLSPSALNLWHSQPGLFALRYIGKIKDESNPAFWRGAAVENGLAAYLLTSKERRNMRMATDIAHLSFDKNAAAFNSGQPSDDERDLIAPMLNELTKWNPPSGLNATQIKVEYFFDPIPIPVIGYLDFAFEGVDIDLKTTKACPSKPRAEHVRQVSLYRAARNRNGGLLYVTDKRHAYYEIIDDEMNEAIAELHADAMSLNNFLSRMETKDDIFKSLPVDYSHYQAPKTKVPLAELLNAG